MPRARDEGNEVTPDKFQEEKESNRSRAPLRDISVRIDNGSCAKQISNSFSTPVPFSKFTRTQTIPVTDIWELLPSSSPEPGRDERLPSTTLDYDQALAGSIKRPSLEWACDNEQRNVKRARKEAFSDDSNLERLSSGRKPSRASRKRTDTKPCYPSPSLRQASHVKRTKSLNSNPKGKGTLPYDGDMLEGALALIELRQGAFGKSKQ